MAPMGVDPAQSWILTRRNDAAASLDEMLLRASAPQGFRFQAY
jgi:hypothetical protein